MSVEKVNFEYLKKLFSELKKDNIPQSGRLADESDVRYFREYLKPYRDQWLKDKEKQDDRRAV